MFKLVVLLSAAVLAAAKPSVIAPVAYSSVHAAPLTIAQQSSGVIHPSPAIIAAPAVYSAAAVGSLAAVAPYAVAPAPLALSAHTPAVVLNAHGVPLDTADVVAARALHYQAKALAGHGVHYLKKRSLAAPLAYSAVLAPAAVSHQSRVDVHSSPAVSYAAAPVVSTYAAAPLISTYAAAPLVHSAPLAYSGSLAYSTPLVRSAPLLSGVHAW